MSEPARSAPRTAAALAARHRDTQAALGRVHEAIARLRREKTPVSAAAVARRAGVSRTFVYTNPDAKTAVAKAVRETADQRRRLLADTDDSREATWRERALNAEDALKGAHAEILAQRAGIGVLLGRIRDLEAEWTQDACSADHHRERHPQTARAPAQHRQPHARRTSHSRPVQPAVPRPSNCRPGSAADRACKPDLSANSHPKRPKTVRSSYSASADGHIP